MRFVEGIAVVQALAAAVKDKGGVRAGMPDLNGVFLKNSGEVVAMAPTTGEPAARELARLLHRLVPSESTPPVGRLFVDRWSTGESTDLGEFSSELGYFARPNGRELLMGVHSRIPTNSAVPAAAPSAIVMPSARELRLEPPPRAESTASRESAAVSWLRSHRRHIVAATAVVAITVAATALVTWFWPAAAAQKPVQAAEKVESTQVVAKKQIAAPGAARLQPTSGSKAATPSKGGGVRASARDISKSPARSSRVSDSLRAFGSPAVPPTTAVSVLNDTPTVPTVALPARNLPDMKIYSAADSEIDPPKLRSTELPEFLIAGFPSRANSVEVIIDKSGDVERVRMLAPPQRIPDIMLLSRVKEWVFEPATKDGAAVRYRLILSWNVTP
jgi:hypothetical protein